MDSSQPNATLPGLRDLEEQAANKPMQEKRKHIRFTHPVALLILAIIVLGSIAGAAVGGILAVTSSSTSATPDQNSTHSSSSSPSHSPSHTSQPSLSPSEAPTTSKPSRKPSSAPSTSLPSFSPSKVPTTSNPSLSPLTSKPSQVPTTTPTRSPSTIPSVSPSISRPTQSLLSPNPPQLVIPYRYAVFDTFDNAMGQWVLANDAGLFGGISPSNWTDNNFRAAQMSQDKNVLRGLFTKRGSCGFQCLVTSNVRLQYSSTNGRIFVLLFRIKNTFSSSVTWLPHFYYSAYSQWGEMTGIAVNGVEVFSAASSGDAEVAVILPPLQTSTVIFSVASGVPVAAASYVVRSQQFAFSSESLRPPVGLSFIDDLDDGFTTTAIYRWAKFDTFDQSNWMLFNDPGFFGGVQPSAWTDAGAVAANMNPTLFRGLFGKKGTCGTNECLMVSETYAAFSSTNGKVFVALFRIRNSQGSPINWTPSFYYTSYASFSETASVSLNGQNTWVASGISGLNQAAVTMSLPPNSISTVVFAVSSGPFDGNVRSLQFGFQANSLTLPTGLSYVDDLDDGQSTATYYYTNFDTYDQTNWMLGNNPDFFGGIAPSTWTDSGANSAFISTSLDALRKLFGKKSTCPTTSYCTISSEVYLQTSSTNGKVTVVAFRVRNSTPNPITWAVGFVFTAFAAFGEVATVALNNALVFNSGSANGVGYIQLQLPIPSNQISTVIFAIPSGGVAQPVNAYIRSNQFGFPGGYWTLPSGLTFVDDLGI